jgi:hypothetical protein
MIPVCVHLLDVRSDVEVYGLASTVCICVGKCEKFVDGRHFAAVMQREAATVMPSCSGGGNVVVA